MLEGHRLTGLRRAHRDPPRTTAVGWQGVDSTYRVCTEDRSTTVGLQRAHAARASRSVDVATGHHPFVSRPDLVVAELAAVLSR
ncbi:hypothetical protein BIU97_06900 [Curtobacterium sp. MCBA15_009]|nr:hypothetical protein BIU97_06900 [Curtobacterium sp. MCBA15_009]